MAIYCPNPECRYKMNLKGVKPGQYKPKCPKCKLVIPIRVDADGVIHVEGQDPSAETAVSMVSPAGGKPSADPNDETAAGTTAIRDAPTKPLPDTIADAANASPDVTAPTSAPSPAQASPDVTAPSSAPPGAAASPDVTAPSGVSSNEQSPDITAPTTAPEASPDVTAPSSVGSAADSPDVTAPSGVGGAQSPDVTAPSSVGSAQSPDVTAPSSVGGGQSPDVTAPSNIGGGAPDVTAPSQAGGPPDVTAPSQAGAAAAAPVKHEKEELGPGVPRQLGGLEMIKELGRGGMGSVYLARQLSLDRNVAVKLMNPQWARNAEFVSRFTREAYAAAQLVHHNVVQIYDIGKEHDVNFFSMEFVEGTSIGALIKKNGKIDVNEAAGYILQAARGLKFAHDQGMIHRDIKPDNLMLSSFGIVKVADLGLVKTPKAVEEEARKASEKRNRDIDDSDSGLDEKTPQPLGASRGASNVAALASAAVTQLDVSMGTPAYMAPEQGRDAANVDARADIYSLGCTLYVMLTGRPVHEGTTAKEVMTKHASEPITPPDVIVHRVPKELSLIIQKMVAKEPDDRYQNMQEVIEAIEGFLGLDSAGPFTPKEEHASVLEMAVQEFNSAKAARTRTKVILGFFAACVIGILAFGFKGSGLMTAGLIGLLFLTPMAYFIVSGITQKAFLFGKFRELILGARWTDWVLWLFFGVLIVIFLWRLGLLIPWAVFLVVAVGLAVGFHMVFDSKVSAERKKALDDVQSMLRSMRLNGLEEDALRQFVCRYCGERWEEFYEALFGYEAKLEARQRWGKGETGKSRKKFRAWREPLVDWVDAKQQQRKEAKQKKHLQTIEKDANKAKGMSEEEAEKKAQNAAAVMVSRAMEMRAQAAQVAAMAASMAPVAAGATQPVPGGMTMPSQAGYPRGANPVITPQARNIMDVTDEDVAAKNREDARLSQSGGFLGLLLGARIRLVLAIIFIGACVLWMDQNGMFPRSGDDGDGGATRQLTEDEQLQRDVERAIAMSEGPAVVGEAKSFISRVWNQETEPLRVPGVPNKIRYQLLNSFNIGIAGLILLFSAIFRGPKMAIFVLPAAAVVFLGPIIDFPDSLPIGENIASFAIGGVLVLLGVFFGRQKRTV